MKKPSLFRSFIHSGNGILLALKEERNIKIHCAALVINIALILGLKLDRVDASIILICCFMVIGFEVLNTSIEKLCDFVEPNFDKRIGAIKDIAAGAVSIVCICAVVVGVLIYKPYLF